MSLEPVFAAKSTTEPHCGICGKVKNMLGMFGRMHNLQDIRRKCHVNISQAIPWQMAAFGAQLNVTATSAGNEKLFKMFGFWLIYSAFMTGRPSVKFLVLESRHCCRGDTGDGGDFDDAQLPHVKMNSWNEVGKRVLAHGEFISESFRPLRPREVLKVTLTTPMMAWFDLKERRWTISASRSFKRTSNYIRLPIFRSLP